MKLVIDGDAAAGTIQLGGSIIHTAIERPARRADLAPASASAPCSICSHPGQARDDLIFSDGSLASDGTIDDSVAGRGKGVWTADNGSVAATFSWSTIRKPSHPGSVES